MAVGLNDPATGVKVPTAREWALLAGPQIDPPPGARAADERSLAREARGGDTQ
jgi:hypothetical protein